MKAEDNSHLSYLLSQNNFLKELRRRVRS